MNMSELHDQALRPETNGQRPQGQAHQLSALRAQLYALLSAGFQEPDENCCDWLRGALQGNGKSEWRGREALGENQPDQLLALRSRFSAILHEHREQLQVEALRHEYLLLCSHARWARCLPYETEFTAPDAVRGLDPLAALTELYHSFGLDGVGTAHQRPDALSLELKFMHHLITEEQKARQDHDEEQVNVCRDAQKQFVKDHLGRWPAAFAAALEREGISPFYTALAELAAEFVAWEARSLQVEPQVVPFRDRRAQELLGDESWCWNIREL